MSAWELFTWANVAVLSLGSVVVFILFLKDVPALLPRRKTDAGDKTDEI